MTPLFPLTLSPRPSLAKVLAALALVVGITVQGSTDPIGRVVTLRGKVQATNAAGQVRQLQLKSPIFEKDTVDTGQSGRIQLSFRDRSFITLGPETSMEIAEYAFDPNASVGAMTTRVGKGVFRVMGGMITKISPEKFITETPTATIGVRGSFYMGSFSNGILKVAFLGGKGIYVRNPQGNVELRTPAEGALVKPNTKPEPVTFSQDDMQGLTDQVAGKPGSPGETTAAPGEADEQPADGNGATADPDQTGEPATEEQPKGEPAKTDGPPAAEKPADPTPTGDGGEAAPKQESELQQPNTATQAATSTAGTGQAASTVTALSQKDSQTTQQATIQPALATTDSGTSKPVESEQYWKSFNNDPILSTTPTGDNSGTAAAIQTPKTELTTGSIAKPEQTLADSTVQVQQSTLKEQVEVQTETAGQTETAPSNLLAGSYLGILASDDENATSWQLFNGTVAATATEGRVEGVATATDQRTGTQQIPFAFPTPSSPDTTEASAQTLERSVTLSDFGKVDISQYDYLYDQSLAEFVAFFSRSPLGTSPAYDYVELGFAGLPALATKRPADGIAVYKGLLLPVSVDLEGGQHNPEFEGYKTLVNFHNKTLIGFAEPKDETLPEGSTATESDTDAAGSKANWFFFGKLNTGATAGITLAGHDTDGRQSDTGGTGTQTNDPIAYIEPTALTGTGTVSFFGTNWQGIGMTAAGHSETVRDQTVTDNWKVGGAQLQTETLATAPTGNAYLHGFAVGVADDMADPAGPNTRTFKTASSDDFTLTLDRDGGTVAGTAKLADNAGTATTLDLTIGGARASAYVSDRAFVALIHGSVSNGTLHDSANFLVSERSSALPDWVRWGTWEAAYSTNEAASPLSLHLHMPKTFWLAAENIVSSLSVVSDAQGRFLGPAMATRFADNSTTSLFGQADFNINFSSHRLGGLLSLQDEFASQSVTMTVSGWVTGNGIDGRILEVQAPSYHTWPMTPTQSHLSGAFYNSAGHLHNAVIPPDRLLGTFGAEFRTPTGRLNDQYVGGFAAELNTDPSALNLLDGHYLGALLPGLESTTQGLSLKGSLKAMTIDGRFYASSKPAVSGNEAGSVFLAAPASAALQGAWTSAVDSATGQDDQTHTLTLAGEAPVVLSYYDYLTSGNPAEFIAFTTYSYYNQTTADLYTDLGFAGIPATATGRPDSGVGVYEGRVQVVATGSNNTISESYFENHKTLVNFHNNAFIGFSEAESDGDTNMSEAKADWFYFGKLGTGSKAAIRLLGHHMADMSTQATSGSDPEMTEPEAIAGSGTAAFFGQDWQGLGMAASGTTETIRTQTQTSTWDAVGAQIKTGTLETAPTGTAYLHGFAVGVADDMADPLGPNTRTFVNGTPDGFKLTLDRDSGTVSGTATLKDATELASTRGTTSETPTSMTLAIGGVATSAYVTDHTFAALVTGQVHSGVTSNELHTNGSFLISGGPGDSQSDSSAGTTGGTSTIVDGPNLPDWAKWGYWEVAYDDPARSAEAGVNHVHMPGALWMAAENAVRDLTAITGATGQYSGSAVCTRISAETQERLFGSSDFQVDFTNRQFSGSMSFGDSISMQAGGRVTSDGISGSITGITEFGGTAITPATSTLQGGFFNQAPVTVPVTAPPDRLLGTFSAETVSGTLSDIKTNYIGGFAGELQPK